MGITWNCKFIEAATSGGERCDGLELIYTSQRHVISFSRLLLVKSLSWPRVRLFGVQNWP